MSTNCSENSTKNEQRRIYLERQYHALRKRWLRCVCDAGKMALARGIEHEIYPIYCELRALEESAKSVSPGKIKILKDADLNTLKDLYRKCEDEGVPEGDLVKEIEKEIYQKWIKASKYEPDHIYRLDPSLTHRKK